MNKINNPVPGVGSIIGKGLIASPVAATCLVLLLGAMDKSFNSLDDLIGIWFIAAIIGLLASIFGSLFILMPLASWAFANDATTNDNYLNGLLVLTLLFPIPALVYSLYEYDLSPLFIFITFSAFIGAAVSWLFVMKQVKKLKETPKTKSTTNEQ